MRKKKGSSGWRRTTSGTWLKDIDTPLGLFMLRVRGRSWTSRLYLHGLMDSGSARTVRGAKTAATRSVAWRRKRGKKAKRRR